MSDIPDAINKVLSAYRESPEDWCCEGHALWEELPVETVRHWLTTIEAVTTPDPAP